MPFLKPLHCISLYLSPLTYGIPYTPSFYLCRSPSFVLPLALNYLDLESIFTANPIRLRLAIIECSSCSFATNISLHIHPHIYTHTLARPHSQTKLSCALPQYAKKKKIKLKENCQRKAKKATSRAQLHFLPHAPWPATCATNCVKAASPDVATCGRSRHCHRHRQRCRRLLPATCVFVSYGAGSGRVAKVPAVMRHVLGLCQRAIKARVNRRGWQSKGGGGGR